MTMLKTIPGHKTVYWIGRYLLYGDRGSGAYRALAVDSRGIVDDARFWREMDETRRAHGKFMASSKGRPREYYHFILSPDEADKATLEQVRELAGRWVDENIDDGFQVAIVYHDDNDERIEGGKDGIVHAHVVVNSVNMLTGAKLQIGSAGKGVDEMADSAQRISEEIGLSAFDNADRSYKRSHAGSRSEASVAVRRKVERLVEKRGETSFKEEVRRAVDANVEASESMATLQARVAPYGFGIAAAASGIVYITPEGRRVGWRVLGTAYGLDGLSGRLAKTSFAAIADAQYEGFAQRFKVAENALSEVDEKIARLQETIDAYSVITREEVSGMDDFARRIDALKTFGAHRRKDLYIANKKVGRLNEEAAAMREIDEGGKPAGAAGLPAALAEEDRRRWAARFKKEGESLLSAQIDVDGTARRIEELQKAKAVAAAVFEELARRAGEERVGDGVFDANPRPGFVPGRRGKASFPAGRRTKAPYWKLQIKRDKYREIAATSWTYRANLLAFERASDPAALMRPYATKTQQIEHSMAAQKAWEADKAAKREIR